MSPEQATGGRELDVRSDVYSLAAVVYEMLAGEPPHTGPTAQAVIAKLLTERPTRIRTVRDTVPEGVDTAVAKALAKVPADRFGGAAEFATALAVPGAGPGAGWPRRRIVVAASLAGAVALAALAVLWHPWRRPARAALAVADVASVAVLPFENLTGSPNDLYLSDGMTEEVIGQLAQVRGLKVISRTSTEALKGAHLTLRQIADTLGVRHILEGSVRHAGNRIRVAVDLIDATTDAHVWASRYDRDLTDLFGVQDEIARHVADSLVSAVGIRRALSRLPRTVAVPRWAHGRRLRGSPSTSSGHSNSGPTPRTCTSGMPDSWRAKAATTKGSPKRSGPSPSTRSLRASGSPSRRQPSPDGATRWPSGRQQEPWRSNPAS